MAATAAGANTLNRVSLPPWAFISTRPMVADLRCPELTIERSASAASSDFPRFQIASASSSRIVTSPASIRRYR